MTEMALGNVQTITTSAERLRFFSFFISLNKIICVYAREQNGEQKEALAAAYKELTGDDIENRLARLRD